MTSHQTALLSVDIEDWFQVENLKGAIPRQSWDSKELRVDHNVDVILELLAANKTHATFFVLGWIAKHAPALVQRIHAQGHEIACHGYGHDLVYDLSVERFREDLRSSKHILEDLVGESVIGYRAPSFSITDWAIDVLMETGLKYDSSLFPSMVHDRYGKLTEHKVGNGGITELAKGFHEVGLSCLTLFGRNVPWAGGGYFRLLPYPVFRAGVRKILRDKGTYCFYIHPWEFDPGQPRIRAISAQYRFRHYKNLGKTRTRFAELIREVPFGRIRDALPIQDDSAGTL